MMRLKNKVAIVTGGNSGIGKGIAQYFHQEGANVVIFGRNEASLDETRHELGDRILAVQGDITHTEDLNNLYEKTQAHFGKIDILIANAGVSERLHVSDVTEEKFDYMVDINYRGIYFTVHYALPFLNANSSIVLIASTAATITLKNHSVYASTKSAVVKLAKNLSYDLANKKIRVNSISPGYIKTPIFDTRLKMDPDYLKKRENLIPLQRIGTPQDIASAALFLSSDEASYITGVDLLVDGGYSASRPE